MGEGGRKKGNLNTLKIEIIKICEFLKISKYVLNNTKVTCHKGNKVK